jgi:hypothetical protein
VLHQAGLSSYILSRVTLHPDKEAEMKPLPTLLAAALALAAGPAAADLSYQCSGIGIEEREAADQVPHTLRLIFAEANGHYLGAVAARVTGGGAELVNVTCPGPWLLVDLPDGRYQVSASFEGKTVTREVTISGGQRQKQVFVLRAG